VDKALEEVDVSGDSLPKRATVTTALQRLALEAEDVLASVDEVWRSFSVFPTLNPVSCESSHACGAPQLRGDDALKARRKRFAQQVSDVITECDTLVKRLQALS
jgi:hypothetical protein